MEAPYREERELYAIMQCHVINPAIRQAKVDLSIKYMQKLETIINNFADDMDRLKRDDIGFQIRVLLAKIKQEFL